MRQCKMMPISVTADNDHSRAIILLDIKTSYTQCNIFTRANVVVSQRRNRIINQTKSLLFLFKKVNTV